MQIDQFGLPITAANAEAAGHFDNAINSYFRFLRDTMVHVDAAIEADPGMPMANCLRGYLQLLATKQEVAALVCDSIQATAAALEGAGGSDRGAQVLRRAQAPRCRQYSRLDQRLGRYSGRSSP